MRDQNRIERLLHELGRGEPPQGMERRIAEALERRLAKQRVRATRWWPARLLLGGAGAAGILAVLLLVPVLSRRGSTPGSQEPQPAAAATAVPRTADESERSAQQRVTESVVARLTAARRPLPKREAESRRHHVTATGNPELAEASYAPTQVAPPEPLTRQERLLVRVVRRGNAEQRAALDPRIRDAQLVAEKAEVDAFFRSPELPKQDQ